MTRIAATMCSHYRVSSRDSLPQEAKDRLAEVEQKIKEEASKGKLTTLVTREQFYGGRLAKLIKPFFLFRKDPPVRKGEQSLKDLPVVLLLAVGVATAAKNNDRKDILAAMEDRAFAVTEGLKKRSFLDWTWYLGYTEPLLGLFGTVTGLGSAFYKFGLYGGGNIERFAPGVAEALITTIMGLIAGITLMIINYYYTYKLERVDSMLRLMGVEFSEHASYKITPPAIPVEK